MWVRPLGGEDPLEEEMATHSSILAWEIPRTEEPGGRATVHVVAELDMTDITTTTTTYFSGVSARIYKGQSCLYNFERRESIDGRFFFF